MAIRGAPCRRSVPNVDSNHTAAARAVSSWGRAPAQRRSSEAVVHSRYLTYAAPLTFLGRRSQTWSFPATTSTCSRLSPTASSLAGACPPSRICALMCANGRRGVASSRCRRVMTAEAPISLHRIKKEWIERFGAVSISDVSRRCAPTLA